MISTILCTLAKLAHFDSISNRGINRTYYNILYLYFKNVRMFHNLIINTNLILVIAYSQRTPMISHITQKRITDIGGTTELTCTVLYGSDFNILWIKVDKERSTDPVTFSSGSTLIIRDSRLSLRYDRDSNSYSLHVRHFKRAILIDRIFFTRNNLYFQISDIQETDAGFYRCDVILGRSNKLSAETELVVRRRPFISDNSTRSLVVNEGQSVILECYAGGYPRPKVSWRRANNAILTNNISIYRY